MVVGGKSLGGTGIYSKNQALFWGVLDELKEIHGKQVEDYQKYLEEYNK